MPVRRRGDVMNPRSLRPFFERRVADGRRMVLGLVFGTSGSTYSKAGDAMLIDGDGHYHGMLSGGCLEGDLAIRAAAVIDSGHADTVVYDLAGDDELWGLGVGCEGRIDVILLPLGKENDYEPFRTMLGVYEGRETACLDVTIAGPAVGTVSIRSESGTDLLSADRYGSGATGEVLTLKLKPLPRVLILGAGPDVVPVLRFIVELGWHVVIADHRPAYIENALLEAADARHCLPSAELAGRLDLDSFDAALVMSHHLASDRNYLEALADSHIGYIGLLGPAARRDRLLREIGAARDTLGQRLHGPAGIDLGGRGPAAIALSLVAGLQRYLAST